MWNRVEYRPLEGFVYAITPLTLQLLQVTPSALCINGECGSLETAATQIIFC